MYDADNTATPPRDILAGLTVVNKGTLLTLSIGQLGDGRNFEA